MIDGKSYTIIGTKSDQHMNTVVSLIQHQLDQLGELSPQLPTREKAILLSINAVSKQLEKQQEIEQLEMKLKEIEQQLADVQKHLYKSTRLSQESKRLIEEDLRQFIEEETV